MFTGIVKTTGKVLRVSRIKNGHQLVINVDKAFGKSIPKGGSVSIDGVCLTVVSRLKDALEFDIMEVTIKRTTLGHLKVGSRVNIEPAARLGEPLGGHFVSGHVDGVAVIKNVKCKIQNGMELELSISKKLSRYLVPQGSVVVNGVSLTVVAIKNNIFSVALTPYTVENTNLGAVRVGSEVNVEVDMLAKYISKFISYDLRNRRRAI